MYAHTSTVYIQISDGVCVGGVAKRFLDLMLAGKVRTSGMLEAFCWYARQQAMEKGAWYYFLVVNTGKG